MGDNRKKLILTLPVPVSVNHYLAYRVVKKGNKYLAVSYCTEKARKYKTWLTSHVKLEAQRQGWDITNDKHIYLDSVFYFPRRRMDPSNYFKIMFDAITDSKAVWKDDDIVCERVQGIFYDTQNPRVEIEIFYVDYIGIFKDEDEFKKFEDKCITCNRYKKGCSIFKNACRGTIQEEVSHGICNKYKGV